MSRFDELRPSNLEGARTLVRLRACWNVDRDVVSGWRVPTFEEDEVEGVLVERGGDMPSFVVGTVMRLDGVLFTVDGFRPLDRVRDPDSGRTYEVREVLEKREGDGNLLYRACTLKLRELKTP